MVDLNITKASTIDHRPIDHAGRNEWEAMVTPQLELNDIQGNTIFGYRFPHTRFVFVRFDEVEGGRRFLRAIEGLV